MLQAKCRFPAEDEYCSFGACCLGLARTSLNSCHIGIIYQDREHSKILHLAHHNKIKSDILPSDDFSYLWIEMSEKFSSDDLEVIAGFCRLVVRENSNSGIAYAFSRPKNFFNPETGELRLVGHGVGLTCATFVLAIFSAKEIELIDWDTWELRDEDAVAQQQLLEKMKFLMSQDHFDAIQSNLPAIRVRPEEVCAALFAECLPVQFPECISLAHQILSCLDQTS